MPSTDTLNIIQPVQVEEFNQEELDSLAFFPMAEAYSYLSGDTLAFDLLQPLPAPRMDMLVVTPGPVLKPWEHGLQGDARHVSVGDNTGVLAIVACVFTLMMLSYRSCKRLFSVLVKGLFSMRRRKNAFNEHTSNETRMLGLMAVQWSVCTGLLLYSFIANKMYVPSENAFADVSALILLMGGYYLFQYCAYATVGYTYTDSVGRRLYLQGFSSSQSLLGFALIIPALVSIFYPMAAMVGIVAGALLYVAARVIFIIKGFRIFYTNFGSLFYFILYLCTLEIVPLLIVWQIALNLLKTVD